MPDKQNTASVFFDIKVIKLDQKRVVLAGQASPFLISEDTYIYLKIIFWKK